MRWRHREGRTSVSCTKMLPTTRIGNHRTHADSAVVEAAAGEAAAELVHYDCGQPPRAARLRWMVGRCCSTSAKRTLSSGRCRASRGPTVSPPRWGVPEKVCDCVVLHVCQSMQLCKSGAQCFHARRAPCRSRVSSAFSLSFSCPAVRSRRTSTPSSVRFRPTSVLVPTSMVPMRMR